MATCVLEFSALVIPSGATLDHNLNLSWCSRPQMEKALRNKCTV